MTREEEFKEITRRLNLPENAKNLKNAKEYTGIGIMWYYNRAEKTLNDLKSNTLAPVDQRLYEDAFSSSIHMIKTLFQQENWF